jgi:hypothetical protein
LNRDVVVSGSENTGNAIAVLLAGLSGHRSPAKQKRTANVQPAAVAKIEGSLSIFFIGRSRRMAVISTTEHRAPHFIAALSP